MPASAEDVMPNFGDTTLVIGYMSDYSDLRPHPSSGFENCGVKKLARTIYGTTAELKKGQAVMLDRISSLPCVELSGVYRLRIHEGESFACATTTTPDRVNRLSEYDKDMEKIFAEMIYAYLHSTPEQHEESARLIAAIESGRRKVDEAIRSYFDDPESASKIVEEFVDRWGVRAKDPDEKE